MRIFWEYIITYSFGSEIRLVADIDRDWVDKQLENDPAVVRYQAKPRSEYTNHNRLPTD